MTHRLSRISAVGAAAVLVWGAAACAPQESPDPATTDACATDSLSLKTPGKLTIATDESVYPPWMLDNNPENKQGFESAVAYAIAEQLGFSDDDVTWVRVTFNSAIAPGPKNFDFDINQFSITEERKAAVDFSSPYYDVRQAVVTYLGSPSDGADSLEALKSAKLGATVGTTSLQAIEEVIAPTVEPSVFNTNEDLVLQLENRTIDGAVFDLPTAFFVTAAQLDDGVIVGQLAQPEGSTPEQFGLVLDKDWAFTACLSAAVDALRADGTLADLEAEWLADIGGAPELR